MRGKTRAELDHVILCVEEVLFGVQLGGGTDINAALAYCEKQIEVPTKTHLVLITGASQVSLLFLIDPARNQKSLCAAAKKLYHLTQAEARVTETFS